MDTIGKICEYQYCNIRDFLPLECDRCKRCHCLEHQKYKEHECTHEYLDIDKNKNKSKIKVKSNKKYKCKYIGCKKKNYVEIICLYCKEHFCTKHISYDIHDCIDYKNK